MKTVVLHPMYAPAGAGSGFGSFLSLESPAAKVVSVEAQAQLKATVDKYGDSSVGSRAQNLLGRAYLDDGKPALASVAFYENYQKRPRGERAPDSLAYLGEALIQLKKPADACKVYQELDQVYGGSLSSSLRGMMDKGRAQAKCS